MARRVLLVLALLSMLVFVSGCPAAECQDGAQRQQVVQVSKRKACTRVQVCADGRYDKGTINEASCRAVDG